MFSHITKLIWNRKKTNMLIIVEVAITFMVLFAIISMATHNYQTYNQALGFTWENRWNVTINIGGQWDNEKDKNQFKELIHTLRKQPEFKSVDMSSVPVFKNWTHTSNDKITDRNIDHNIAIVNYDAPANWGVELSSGRWFSEQDNGQNYTPVMINQLFAELAFDNKDPVNFEYSDPDNPEIKPQRIVGVFKSFKQQGDFSEAFPYLFKPYILEEGRQSGIYFIQLTFNQAKTADYEEKLLKILKGVAPSWEFEIRTWKAQRDAHIKEVLIPLIIMSIVVGFLLIMVAMGLFGVLWQNINRRTQEIGLRRAIGASKNSIQLQIIGELLIVALFGMTIAFFILVQLPILQLIYTVTWSNFWLSILGSISVMVLMVILCALYPSRVAIKLAPALALHYE